MDSATLKTIMSHLSTRALKPVHYSCSSRLPQMRRKSMKGGGRYSLGRFNKKDKTIKNGVCLIKKKVAKEREQGGGTVRRNARIEIATVCGCCNIFPIIFRSLCW
jgi:hypothetical protein